MKEKIVNPSQKVPMMEKIGYSLGDGAANLAFQMMMMFQMFFYTDVFGIKATAAGTILLMARLIDAFVDPVVGVLADRTQSRWGKYHLATLDGNPFCRVFCFGLYNTRNGRTGQDSLRRDYLHLIDGHLFV